MDLFAKFSEDKGPLGQHSDMDHTNFFMFPKLEGPIAPRMMFRGKEVLTWSLNNYLGLANLPEVREADAKAAADWGLAYPMGARMMTGNTAEHEGFEKELAEFVKKEDAMLLNFGYQGIMSVIDAVCGRKDVVVYDAECHACIIDGLRLHVGKRFVYQHNDMESLEKQLVRADKLAKEQGGGLLVITEGVFGMSGSMGNLKGVTDLKEKFEFRLLVDDAHGFGTMGKTGAGAGEEQGVQDKVDLYFSTFAKAMASIGGFVAGEKDVIDYLRYNMRSQIFAKSLPMALTIGNRKRLEMLRTKPELKDNLWKVVNKLQSELKANGFNIGKTQSPVTPVLLSGGWKEAANMIQDIRNEFNLFCSMIVYPVVPKDVIMLRIIPTAMHTLEDVDETIRVFKAVKNKLDTGVYRDADEPVFI
ncbi:aminotransferase class I/II-fold pyridoxal phosphate-dependent enzyme [Reichenbachiella versicolor]|uniref:aminotransferase class I/II-fold pyridoxal phosphate-dependent enzyme n=1 Tax=Reichenbachiella versicolor TaxID=1821036 RepID=UPI000D6E0F8E|nr:pyridoxal phosphate-dependent aminotransferase family protein [Reichenbachiella versicolor]